MGWGCGGNETENPNLAGVFHCPALLCLTGLVSNLGYLTLILYCTYLHKYLRRVTTSTKPLVDL